MSGSSLRAEPRKAMDDSSAAPLLDVRDLRVALPGARGPVEVLHGVSFAVARGETVGLIGESGCGKSITALAVMGLPPEGARVSGSMRFDGVQLCGLPDDAHGRLRGRRIAMVFQEPMTALNPLHPIGRQIAEPLRVHLGADARSARAEALRLLEQVRMPDAARRLDAYPHQLSGGQRQRVMLALALACSPELLIADEPTTALDASLQREMLKLIAALVAERHMALLLISHDLAMVAAEVQTTLVMYAGHVVERAPSARLFSAAAHPYTRALLGARPRLGLRRTSGHGSPVRLPTIGGRVPLAGETLPGCPFAPRCPFVVDECRRVLPALAPVAGGAHDARCIRAEDVLVAQRGGSAP